MRPATRHARALRATFERIVAVASAGLAACAAGAVGAGATACSSPDQAGDAGVGPTEDAGADATLPVTDSGDGILDATVPFDAALDAAPDTACSATFLDGADDGSGCDYFSALRCGAPPLNQDCYLYLPECAALCGASVAYPCFVLGCGEDGGLPPPPWTLECTTGKLGCGDAGRRPAGLVEAGPTAQDGGDVVGAWLARVARLEAASVVAFRRLAAELRGLGAPRTLVARARRSARDEVRHARVTARLARARGAKPGRLRVARARTRLLREIAIENAVEGCVRESFAALVATWRARHAADPSIARAMAGIAKDETRHAALAWCVADWLDPHLDEADRAAVAAALRTALAALWREVADVTEAPAELASAAGLPTAPAARALLESFAAALLP